MDDAAPNRLDALTRDIKTTAGKIRRLAAEGLPRAEIARFLGVRYQQVRNVLVADEEKAAASPLAGPETARMDPAGRVLIPAKLRDALGVGPGDEILLQLEEGELRLFTREAGLRRARRLVRALLPPDANLADELIADRRREAEREARET